jgi:hypothetical protein
VFKTVPSTSVARTVTLVVSGDTLANEVLFTDYALTRAQSGELTWSAPRCPGRRHRPDVGLIRTGQPTTTEGPPNMGFKRPQTVYALVFDHHDGLQVRAASVPVGRLLELVDMADKLKAGQAKALSEVRGLFEAFTEALRSWNLEEDDGTPVPATGAGVLSLEFGFASELILAWFDAIGDVPDPLERRSTVTLPSEELSIPMEVLSPSR